MVQQSNYEEYLREGATVYDIDELDALIDDDIITLEEAAIMRGYYEE